MPNPGRIHDYMPPGGAGIRMDSHLFSGYVVPPFYDSLLGKVICWGRDRNEAIVRTLRALDELVIQGVTTTVDFHKAMISSDDFKNGKVHTRYVQDVFMDKFMTADASV
jgi:acetyl-CoA carboxylase biotin carboxylase subunit